MWNLFGTIVASCFHHNKYSRCILILYKIFQMSQAAWTRDNFSFHSNPISQDFETGPLKSPKGQELAMRACPKICGRCVWLPNASASTRLRTRTRESSRENIEPQHCLSNISFRHMICEIRSFGSTQSVFPIVSTMSWFLSWSCLSTIQCLCHGLFRI